MVGFFEYPSEYAILNKVLAPCTVCYIFINTFHFWNDLSLSLVCSLCVSLVELPEIESFQFNPNGVNGGQAVRVMCMITSGDLPIDIYWLKDGQPLLRSIYHKIDEYTLILSLRQTNIGDAGNYTCVANNKAGEARKWSILKVKGRGKISLTFPFLNIFILLNSILFSPLNNFKNMLEMPKNSYS